MTSNFSYKWSKLFASKRFNTTDGVIKLTPAEQQELLDDAKKEFERGFEIGYKECLGDELGEPLNPER